MHLFSSVFVLSGCRHIAQMRFLSGYTARWACWCSQCFPSPMNNRFVRSKPLFWGVGRWTCGRQTRFRCPWWCFWWFRWRASAWPRRSLQGPVRSFPVAVSSSAGSPCSALRVSGWPLGRLSRRWYPFPSLRTVSRRPAGLARLSLPCPWWPYRRRDCSFWCAAACAGNSCSVRLRSDDGRALLWSACNFNQKWMQFQPSCKVSSYPAVG